MAKRAERGKAYYMISAVSQKYNIHPQTLRLYEREGLLKPSRTEGNTRLYSEEDLEQLETILALTRDLGVNLAGVEIILNMRRKIEQMQGEVNEFMDYVKRELARGIDDWEQRLSTALVKSSPTDLVRHTPQPDADETRSANCESQECKSNVPLGICHLHVRQFRISALRSAVPACPICDDTGWKTIEVDGVSRVTRCDCWRSARRRRACMAEARIPRRYQHCDLDNFDAYNEQLAQGAAARAPSRREFPVVDKGLFFQGRPGVGKTHLAVAVLRQVHPRTRRARPLLRHARAAASVIRSTYDPVNRTQEMDVLRPVIEADLLVLDDLGAEKTSEWVEETLNLIVNTRYSERRTTIFTSNYDDTRDTTEPELARCSASASGCGRACTRCASSSSSTAPTTASCRRTAASDDLMTMWKMRGKLARKTSLPLEAQRPGARPAARNAVRAGGPQVVGGPSRDVGQGTRPD